MSTANDSSIDEEHNIEKSRIAVDLATVRGLRDQLASLLAAVARGDVTAPAGMILRLEGAVEALDALSGDAAHPWNSVPELLAEKNN